MLGLGLSLSDAAVRRLGLGIELPPAVMYDTDAQALFQRFDIEPTPERKQLISDRFVAGKAKSFWTKLDALWVHAAHGAEAGRLNWLSDRFDCLPVNSPTFTVDRGYTGDGVTSYLDTQYNPATAAGIKATRDSASLGIRSNTDNQGTGSLAGFFNTATNPQTGTTINPRTGGNTASFRMHSHIDGAVNSPANIDSAIGMFTVVRTGPTSCLGYRNGAQVAASNFSSQPMVSGKYRLGSIHNSSYRACQFSMGFVGASLTPQEVQDLFEWFQPYRTALGII